eukprot:COSAG05_NODE_5566_length_1138_cov_1.967276_3_plen_73_part_00
MRFSLPARVLCVFGLVFSAVAAMPADSELGEGGEDMSAWVVVLLVLCVCVCGVFIRNLLSVTYHVGVGCFIL